MRNCIIAISREYGSGGRDVGRMLAEELNLPLFDKEIMSMAMEKSGMSADFIEKHGESVPSKLMLNIQRLSLTVPSVRIPTGHPSYAVATSPYKKPHSDQLYMVQSSIIREIAASGGCVIIGRCAGYILRGYPNLLSIFIRGKIEDRVQRAIEVYKMPEKNATDEVKKIDKHRANFYNHYTNRQWGSVNNYDLVVNVSYSGIPGAVSVIKAMSDVRATVSP